MISRLNKGVVVEFEPPALVSVVFLNQEIYTFKNVAKALKEDDGTLHLEFQDQTFAELKPPYLFFQVGSEIDND